MSFVICGPETEFYHVTYIGPQMYRTGHRAPFHGTDVSDFWVGLDSVDLCVVWCGVYIFLKDELCCVQCNVVLCQEKV